MRNGYKLRLAYRRTPTRVSSLFALGTLVPVSKRAYLVGF